MNKRWRLRVFLVAAAGLAAMFALVIVRMPPPHASRYGDLINRLCTAQRHVTDAVTAVNFDYRGFDTLGEEFILFVSVMGAVVLLREAHEQKKEKRMDAATPLRVVGPTDAVRVWTLAMTGPTVLFGIYVVLHGQLTPGGGFQGGVILATAPLLIYLAESYDVFKRVTSSPLIEASEAIAAGAYGVIGLAGCLAGTWYLQNVFPLGANHPPNLLSGGTVAAINGAVGLEVAAGFTLLLTGFLQHVLADSEGG